MVRNVVLPAILATLVPAVTLDEAENEKAVSFPFIFPSSSISSQPQSFVTRRAFNKHCFGFVASAVEGAHVVSAEKLATRVLPLCRGDATQCQQWSSDLWSAVANKMQVDEYSEGVQKISTRLVAGPETVTDWCKEVYSTNLGIDLAVYPTGQEPEFTPQATTLEFGEQGNAQTRPVPLKFNKPFVKSVPRAVVASPSDVKTVEPDSSHRAASEAVATTSTSTAAPTTPAIPTAAVRPTTTAVPVASTTVPAKAVTTTVISRHEALQSVQHEKFPQKTAQVTTTNLKFVSHQAPTTTAAPSTHPAAQQTTTAPTKLSSPPVRPSIAKLAEKAAAKLAAKRVAAKSARPTAKQPSSLPSEAAKVVPPTKTAKLAANVEAQPAAQLAAQAQPTSKLAAKPLEQPPVQPAAKPASKLQATPTPKPASKLSPGEKPAPVVRPDANLGAAVPLLRKAAPIIAAVPKAPVAVAATASAHATATADTAAVKEECVCVERNGKKTCHCHTPGSHKRRRYGSR